MSILKRAVAMTLAILVLPPAAIAQAERPRDFIIVRTSDRPVAQVVEAIEAHIKAKSYQNLGVNVVKPPQGEVTFVKFCAPSVGRQLWAVDLKLSAMLPCGNIGVYSRDGKTEISILHPAYMAALYPDAAVAKASATAEPLLMEMLDEVSGTRRP